MTKTAEKFTYMRDKVPAERMGQCPCCLKNHRSSAGGSLVRHGWKEMGRRIGQYGCGFQWGNCVGSKMRPLEQTDADGLVVLTRLADSIKDTEKGIELHTAGADSYHHEFTIETEYERTPEAKAAKVEKYAAALKALKLTFTGRDTQERKQSFRVFYHTAHTFTIEVARGAKAIERKSETYMPGEVSFSIPSYEAKRKSVVTHLEAMLKSLKAQREAIKLAIKHHAENPSNGSPDAVRRGNLTHYEETYVIPAEKFWQNGAANPNASVKERTRTRVACGKRANTMRGRIHVAKTDDKAKVTCSKCLKAMGG